MSGYCVSTEYSSKTLHLLLLNCLNFSTQQNNILTTYKELLVFLYFLYFSFFAVNLKYINTFAISTRLNLYFLLVVGTKISKVIARHNTTQHNTIKMNGNRNINKQENKKE